MPRSRRSPRSARSRCSCSSTSPARSSERLRSQAALVLAGAALVCVGTLASRSTWLATLATALVGVLRPLRRRRQLGARGGDRLDAARVHPLGLDRGRPSRRSPTASPAGAMAGAASLVAIVVLWPAPAADRLRAPATAACRALAAGSARTRSTCSRAATGCARTAMRRPGAPTDRNRGARRTFLATPYRPTGLSSAARAIVRLVDEIAWLHAILAQAPPHPRGVPTNRPACAVKLAAATSSRTERTCSSGRGHPGRAARRPSTSSAPRWRASRAPSRSGSGGRRAGRRRPARLVSALDPGFRAQELAFAVSQIAANVDAAAAADRRPWHARMLGRRRRPACPASPRPPGSARSRTSSRTRSGCTTACAARPGSPSPFSSRASPGCSTRSGSSSARWRCSGRARSTPGRPRSAASSARRSASSSARRCSRSIGTNTSVLWVLLPPAVLVAGFAPAALSFAAGQAAFTVTLVILYNLIQPAGWHVGLIRIEDVAIGFAVSIVVGLLFWPRGAVTALCRELSEAYARQRALPRRGGRVRGGRRRAAIARRRGRRRRGRRARRLDDAFRTFLAERAAKPAPLAEVTGLVNGVVALRLAADAVVDLWGRDGRGDVDRGPSRAARARRPGVVGWYEELAAALGGGRPRPRAARAGRRPARAARRRGRPRAPRRRRARRARRRRGSSGPATTSTRPAGSRGSWSSLQRRPSEEVDRPLIGRGVSNVREYRNRPWGDHDHTREPAEHRTARRRRAERRRRRSSCAGRGRREHRQASSRRRARSKSPSSGSSTPTSGLERGSDGWRIVPELTPGDAEPLVEKSYGDSFEDTSLETVLSGLGVGRLVVVGAQTDACIRSTLHGAFARGYDATLVSDAHTTEDQTAWGRRRRSR